MQYFRLVASLLCLVSASHSSTIQLQNPVVKIQSAWDNGVITTTDIIQDPGPYNIYGVISSPDEGTATQRWEHSDQVGVVTFRTRGEQFWNYLGTYKASSDSFAVPHTWEFFETEEMDGNGILRSRNSGDVFLVCLENPGNGEFLTVQPCNYHSTVQHWKIIET